MATTIAVTGKGGVGKTTIAALVIRYLKENTPGPILALDADPDCNLAAVLGVEVDTTIGDLREDIQKEMKNFPLGMSKEQYVEAGLHQIVVETPKLDLITMGRGEGPGCYCYINNLLRKFADDLLPSYQWLVMDNEAGLEHLSRRTTSRIDILLVVVNEHRLALDCARRVDELLASLQRDVHHKYVILNGVREDRLDAVKERVADLDLQFLGSVPHDPALDEAIFRGESIYAAGDSPAVAEMNKIMETLVAVADG